MQESTIYTVRLIGETWEGFTSSYEYTFRHEPTAEEIKSKAGDFQSITDYQVYRQRTVGTWESETTTRELIRNWQNENNAIAYVMAGGN
jgi:hypothetical protein